MISCEPLSPWLHLSFARVGAEQRPVLLAHARERPVVCAEYDAEGPARLSVVLRMRGEWRVTEAGEALGLRQQDLAGVSGPGLLSERAVALSVRFKETA
jgi:hypothetical protein